MQRYRASAASTAQICFSTQRRSATDHVRASSASVVCIRQHVVRTGSQEAVAVCCSDEKANERIKKRSRAACPHPARLPRGRRCHACKARRASPLVDRAARLHAGWHARQLMTAHIHCTSPVRRLCAIDTTQHPILECSLPESKPM